MAQGQGPPSSSIPPPRTTAPAPTSDEAALEAQIAAALAGQDEVEYIGGLPAGYKVRTGKAGNVRKPELQNYMGPVAPGLNNFLEEELIPQYKEGAQYEGFAGRDPVYILGVQRQLEQAGVLTKKYQPGVWDPVTESAMEMLMGTANKAGKSWEEMLKSWQAYKPEDDTPGAVLQVKDPEEVKTLLRETSGKILGRSLTPAEETNLLNGYQNIDRAAQEALAAARIQAATSGENVTVTAAPDAQTWAAERLRTQNKDEAQWVTANQRMGEFYSLLGERSFGGTPGGSINNG